MGSLSDVFNHAASGKPGKAPKLDPPSSPRRHSGPFDPKKVEMKTKRQITAPKTAKWRKKGRGGPAS